MSEQRTRQSAYADLVSAVLAARSAPATERFDAEIAAAERAGRLDAATARTLRYWQRASVAEIVEHAVTVLPPTLAAGDDADHEAHDAVTSAAAAWDRARPLLPSDEDEEDDDEDDPAPDSIVLTDRSDPVRAATTGAPRRRLLVAGLTVIPETGDA